jgi:hypothetical protein
LIERKFARLLALAQVMVDARAREGDHREAKQDDVLEETPDAYRIASSAGPPNRQHTRVEAERHLVRLIGCRLFRSMEQALEGGIFHRFASAVN